MNDMLRCPACATVLRIPAGAAPGSVIMCPKCTAKLSVPGAAALAPSRAPSRGYGHDRDDDTEVLEPRKKPKKKPRGIGVPRAKGGDNLGVIIGLVCVIVLLAAGIGVGVWLWNSRADGKPAAVRMPDGPPPFQPPVQNRGNDQDDRGGGLPGGGGQPGEGQGGGGPGQPGGAPPPFGGGGAPADPPAGGQLFTLSNGKWMDGLGGPSFEADFAINGQLRIGPFRYCFVVHDPNGDGWTADYNPIELRRIKTFRMRGMGGFGRMAGGNYQCWVEERPFGMMRGGEGRKVSNVLTLQKSAERSGPPFGPRF